MAKKEVLSVDNLEIHRGKDSVIISVNPKIYPLDTIFSAGYIFIDKAYVIVDGDPNEEIIVQLKAKDKKTKLEDLGREFNNELINYSFYAAQTAKNMPIRTSIVQRAFFTQAQKKPEIEFAKPVEQKVENIEEIAKPWKSRRQKVGKNKSGRKKSKS